MSAPTNPWLLAARPRTLPAAFAPVALGSAFALAKGSFQILPAALCAAFALLAQIGANLANDYLDARRGADTPGRLGPVRVVASGLVSATAMLRATLLVFVLAAAAGLGLIHYGGWSMVIVGAASLLGAVAYTPLAYYGLGEMFALVYFGFVAVIGTYYVQTRDWPPPPGVWLVAAACGLLAANILLVNNIRDRATDAQAGKRTLTVQLGRKFAHCFYGFNVAFAASIAALLCGASFNLFSLLGVAATVPLGLFLLRALMTTPEGDGARYNQLLALSAQYLALWAGFMTLGLVLAKH